MVLLPWQEAVMGLILEALGGKNKAHMKINVGRRGGHTTLAAEVVKRMPDRACTIVPNEAMPYAHKQHLAKMLASLEDRIWVSSPLEAVHNDGVAGKVTKYDILERNFDPLAGKEICIVDGASHFSQWELDPIRLADWKVLVELG